MDALVAVSGIVTGVWLVALAVGWVRLRRAIRDLERMHTLRDAARRATESERKAIE